MIKRILLISSISFLIAIMLWGFWGWFIADKSEKQLKAFIIDNFHEAEFNSVDASLLHYKRTFFGATATIKISSKVDFIEEQLGDLFLKAKLLNGPVFYDNGQFFLGKALWKISFDQSVSAEKLSDSSQEKIRQLFKSKSSFLSVLIGFDNSLTYRSHIKELSSSSLQIKNIVSEGKTNTKVLFQQLNIQLKNISFLSEIGVIDIPQIDIKIDRQVDSLGKHLRYSSKPFLVSYTHNKKKYLIFLKGFFYNKNNKLSGLIDLKYHIDGEPSVENNLDSGLSIELKDLSIKGYQYFLQTEAQIQNLTQQVLWTIEDNAETPEGQDHIWKLYDQIKSKHKLASEIVPQVVFADKASRLNFSLDLPKNNEILTPFLKRYLLRLADNGIVNQWNQHYQLEIKYNKNKLLINNNPMNWTDFLKNISVKGTKYAD